MVMKISLRMARYWSEKIRILAYKINFRLYRIFHGKPDAFLRNVNGVIHIGASTGQERTHYSQCDLNVLWIEADPIVFSELSKNLIHLPRQRALNYLVDFANNSNVLFNIASNSGESSSLLQLHDHKVMYPDVVYVASNYLESRTLDDIIDHERIILSQYNSLILDVQGAELRVLQGASNTMKKMIYIQVEVSDFQAYKNCPVLSQMSAFMNQNNFKLDYLQRVSFSPRVGTYYNAIYKNCDSNMQLTSLK